MSNQSIESGYPRSLSELADHIGQRGFPFALCQFLFMHNHPDRELPNNPEALPTFGGEIKGLSLCLCSILCTK